MTLCTRKLQNCELQGGAGAVIATGGFVGGTKLATLRTTNKSPGAGIGEDGGSPGNRCTQSAEYGVCPRIASRLNSSRFGFEALTRKR